MNNWDVVVVGGGWAGVSAAVQAGRRGAKVLVLEQGGVLGGRASSLTLPDGEIIDNGQHLFLGAYHATKDLLESLGTAKEIEWAPGLSVPYLCHNGSVVTLTAGPLPGPLALLQGLAGFGALSPEAKAQARALGWKGVAQLLPALLGALPASSADISVKAWLERCGQGTELQRWLWEPLCLAALNAKPEQGRLREFLAVLGQGFLRGGATSALGRSRAPLSKLLAPAVDFFGDHGAVRGMAFVESVEVQGPLKIEIRLRGGETITTERAIVAMPARLALPLFNPQQRAALNLEAELQRPLSPIVSVMVWSQKPLLPATLMAMGPELSGDQARFHWAFEDQINVDRYRTCLVASAATDLAALPSEALQVQALAFLAQRLPGFDPERVDQVRVIREKAATPIFLPGSPARPRQSTPWANLALAGDYTETGLPATIEGAVRSGVKAWEALAI
jgi:squalene-associated FAD-dependent desaturase